MPIEAASFARMGARSTASQSRRSHLAGIRPAIKAKNTSPKEIYPKATMIIPTSRTSVLSALGPSKRARTINQPKAGGGLPVAVQPTEMCVHVRLDASSTCRLSPNPCLFEDVRRTCQLTRREQITSRKSRPSPRPRCGCCHTWTHMRLRHASRHLSLAFVPTSRMPRRENKVEGHLLSPYLRFRRGRACIGRRRSCVECPPYLSVRTSRTSDVARLGVRGAA